MDKNTGEANEGHLTSYMSRHQSVKPALPLPVRLRADVRVRGRGVGIAMIDSDFADHPDLSTPQQRIRRYVDVVEGTESATPPAGPTRARQWHGTMTACTAAGNGMLSQGVFTSLAPEAHLVLVRTMNDEGRVTTQTIVDALHYVRDHANAFNIRIVNISVYADEIDHSLEHPVNQAVEELIARGICVVAAAGNNPTAPIRPPAAAPHCIAVGGLNDRNSLAGDDHEMYHSTFGITTLGVQKPDIIAPAIFLPAPILVDTPEQREAAALCAMDAMTDDMLLECAPRLMPHTKLPVALWTSRRCSEIRQAVDLRIHEEHLCSPSYKMVDGTSFAAPIVASIIAQMLEADPSLTPAEVKDLLLRHARPLPGVSPYMQGAGIAMAAQTLAAVQRAVAPASP